MAATKIEIGKNFPQYFKPAYPEEFELFSHFEVTAGIPTVLFAITTWKENGKPNVCFHSWSCFHGDKTAFFAVMGNLYQHTHTYANIQREKCFCINFLPVSAYDRLVRRSTAMVLKRMNLRQGILRLKMRRRFMRR